MNDSIFSADFRESREQIPKGLPLVLAMSGVNDAGGVVAQLQDFLRTRCHVDELVRFHTDLFLDYRARRPLITFDEDHFVDYDPEELLLLLCEDELGAPFLLLSGFEPDFRWEQFVAAVLKLVRDLEVSTTVWVQSFPMPLPHTRPLRATVSGTRAELIAEHSAWKPKTKLPASITHVLEYQLQQSGQDVAGFAILIPHYLAANDYPEALIYALDAVMAATGLIFTADDVRETARQFRVQVDTQIADNQESLAMLHGLEHRYDAYMNDLDREGASSPLVAEDDTLPTADQLATELERFLSQQHEDPTAE